MDYNKPNIKISNYDRRYTVPGPIMNIIVPEPVIAVIVKP